MSVFFDGTTDYAETGTRYDTMLLGQVNCARVDHGIQEAVDADTGESHALAFMGGWRQWRDANGNNAMCPICIYLVQAGKDACCDVHHPPTRPGICAACWAELHDPTYVSCALHMVNRRIPGVDGCPICALDPIERMNAAKHVARTQEVARAIPEPEPETIVVVGAHDLVGRAAAIARRAARSRLDVAPR